MADQAQSFLYKISLPAGDKPWSNNPEFKKKLEGEIATGLYVKGPGVLGKATGIVYGGLSLGVNGTKAPTNEWVALSEEQYRRELDLIAQQEKQKEEAAIARLKEIVLVRFDVNGVEASTSRASKKNAETLSQAWQSFGAKQVEASSPIVDGTILTFDKNNLLARAVHKAFYDHHPLRLSPDIIWITIAQGFATHVNENAEELRSRFVSFEEKKQITISRPGFVKGSSKNDWVGVFPEFSQKIEEYIGAETRALIENDFSTTTVVEKTVSQIVLMESVKAYFDFVMRCGCGIPYIELTGTVDDWKKIRTKAAALKDFELSWWIDALLPILDEFVTAAEGNADKNFWSSICNLHAGSGLRTPITGWIQTFFPYLLPNSGAEKKVRNTYLTEYQVSITNKAQDDLEKGFAKGKGCGGGVKLELIPTGISKVPFKYLDGHTGKSYDMFFCGGITCLTQDDYKGTLEPKVGWAVIE